MKKFAFFLGGYDAEMVSIQKILTETGEKIFDNALSWNNAKLSTYKQEMESLAEDEIPVFIELQLDCSFSDNSIIIDHHNENAGIDKATSIEQVAALIDIKLNRFQQLISANDRGHIRGMMKLCATEDEIQKIRRFDREAQGVTEEDEKLAERSIRERLEVIDGHTAIVDSLTEKTSPIFDALYGKHTHIFILTPEGGLNYSGTGEMVDRLDNIYSGLREKEPDFKFWKGGELPESGFFGADKQFSTDMRRVITSMVDGTPNKIISNHIFMFPFTIEMKNGCTENSSMHDTKLFFNNITASLQKSGWYNKAFRPDSSNLAYNEFFYFHKFARNAIYDIGSQSECDNSKYKDKPNPLILYFTRDTKDGKFEITLKTGETYSLDLQNISIRIYGTEIGILVIEASNKSHRNIEDIIKINDYGRRLYPQFLDEINGVDTTKDVFLADKILMKFKGFESSESFELNDFRKRHIVVAEYVRKLLGEDFTTDDSGDSVKSRRRPYFVYSPIIDDRMYVVCWYGSDEYSDKIKEKDLNGDFCYEDDQMWYRFIFLDGNDVNCKHPGMMKSLIRGTTYKRWAGDGILYGISRYSLVCISGSSGNIVRGHMRKMYAQMAVLLLAQRASILQFSNRVAHISKQIEMLSIIKENNDHTSNYNLCVRLCFNSIRTHH